MDDEQLPGNRLRRRNTNEEDDFMPMPPVRLIRWGIFGSLLTALLPLHVWGAYNFSFRTLLYGYAFAIVGAFYGIAAIILLLGVMVPPIMFCHWVWEVWNEPVPVAEQDAEQPVEVGGDAGRPDDADHDSDTSTVAEDSKDDQSLASGRDDESIASELDGDRPLVKGMTDTAIEGGSSQADTVQG